MLQKLQAPRKLVIQRNKLIGRLMQEINELEDKIDNQKVHFQETVHEEDEKYKIKHHNQSDQKTKR